MVRSLSWLVAFGLVACGGSPEVSLADAASATDSAPDTAAEPSDIGADAASDTDPGPETPDAEDASDPSWRSVLYPKTWTPTDTDDAGRFLHDFSYAGYHNGEVPLPEVVTPVFPVAPPTVDSDSTAAIQAALDAAGQAGGGVVQLAKGLYRVDGVLTVAHSHVVLRGVSPAESRLWFTRSEGMSFKSHLTFAGSVADGPDLPLVHDADNRAFAVRVADASGLAPGQTVALGWVVTPEFVAEHGMTGTWQAFNGKWQPFFRRTVVAVDTTVSPHRVVLDVPLRYRALLRDQASLRVQTGYLTEVGVERVGLANAVGWQDAWAQTQVHVLELRGVADAWVRDVETFVPPGAPQEGPGTGAHLQSGGVLVAASMRVTVADSRFGRAQHRGGGGNGYLVEVRTSSEVLVRDCVARDGRHNFIQNWGFGTSGWVLLRCVSLGGTNRLSRDLDVGLMAPSELHHSLAMANLVDSCTFDDGFSAKNRQGESSGAGHTATETVLWNTRGAGNVRSLQYGWGYVIGTAPATTVATQLAQLDGSGQGTAPEDWREGLGQAATLEPQSLYESQRARRLGLAGAAP